MCHHPNSHTHRPWTHVENTATYDTNSQVQRHEILEATTSSKKIRSLRQVVTCFVSFDIRIWISCSNVRWKWKYSFRWKQHSQRITHTGYVPLFIHICLRKTLTKLHTNVSQEWVRFYWARNAGSIWSPNVLCSFIKNSSLRRLRVSGFAASDDVLDTECKEHQKGLRVARSVYNIPLHLRCFRHNYKLLGSESCLQFDLRQNVLIFGTSVSRAHQMGHIVQSHIPTTQRTPKYDHNAPSEGACGSSLAYTLRPVKFKYEWSYTTSSPCAFKACTTTNLTDFSYELFMQICRFIQTYSESWLKG
jgi:hypothetical protein